MLTERYRPESINGDLLPVFTHGDNIIILLYRVVLHIVYGGKTPRSFRTDPTDVRIV